MNAGNQSPRTGVHATWTRIRGSAQYLCAFGIVVAGGGVSLKHGGRNAEILVMTQVAALLDEVPTAGFDLPLRILVWEDADGSVMVTSNTIELYTERHGVVDTDLTMINGALNNFVAAATGVPTPMPAPADDAGDSVVAPGAVVEFVNLEFDRFLEVQPTGNVYTSNQSNTATEFILHPVDGLDDTFLIQSVSTGLYVHGHGEGNDFNVDIDGTPDEFDYWRIDLVDEGYHVFNVGRERLLQADRAGFNVDTNREVIDAMDFALDVEWNITAVEDE